MRTNNRDMGCSWSVGAKLRKSAAKEPESAVVSATGTIVTTTKAGSTRPTSGASRRTGETSHPLLGASSQAAALGVDQPLQRRSDRGARGHGGHEGRHERTQRLAVTFRQRCQLVAQTATAFEAVDGAAQRGRDGSVGLGRDGDDGGVQRVSRSPTARAGRSWRAGRAPARSSAVRARRPGPRRLRWCRRECAARRTTGRSRSPSLAAGASRSATRQGHGLTDRAHNRTAPAATAPHSVEVTRPPPAPGAP